MKLRTAKLAPQKRLGFGTQNPRVCPKGHLYDGAGPPCCPPARSFAAPKAEASNDGTQRDITSVRPVLIRRFPPRHGHAWGKGGTS